MDKAMEMAEKIAGNAPLPVQTAKRVFIQTMDMPLSAAMEFDSVAATTAIIAEDVFEAMAAKLEKRKPDFKAK